jgi:hypothetical protein
MQRVNLAKSRSVGWHRVHWKAIVAWSLRGAESTGRYHLVALRARLGTYLQRDTEPGNRLEL